MIYAQLCGFNLLFLFNINPWNENNYMIYIQKTRLNTNDLHTVILYEDI